MGKKKTVKTVTAPSFEIMSDPCIIEPPPCDSSDGYGFYYDFYYAKDSLVHKLLYDYVQERFGTQSIYSLAFFVLCSKEESETSGEIAKMILEREDTNPDMRVECDIVGEYGHTLLTASCKTNKVFFVKMLLEKGANVNLTCKKNCTPLWYAVKEKNIEIIKLLLDNNADINYVCGDGEQEIFSAHSGKIGSVLKLAFEMGEHREEEEKKRQEVIRLLVLAGAKSLGGDNKDN